ncbi:hypothetical protein [Nonomuraea insulae]|uniref:N-acetyltransferase domain-containing protein n=1 Tax=Nonomuraea insulae TaxID=1616787 RepID=A0ABW1D1E3_9ACTN
MTLGLLTGEQSLVRQPELVHLYRSAFTGPPWHENESAVTAFDTRLTADARRPGFRAALAAGRWLLTSPGASDAVRLYERSGWERAGEDRDVVVFVRGICLWRSRRRGG